MRIEKPRVTEEGAVGGGTGADKVGGLGGVGLFVGWMLSLGGLISALVGVLSVDVTFEAFGIVAGIAGYVLGARRLGAAAIVVSTVLMLVVLVVLVVLKGEIPGL